MANPSGRPVTEPSVRFWTKVDKNGPIAPGMDTPCWLWTAGKQGGGYGHFATGHRGGAQILAHKWAWEQENGPVPPGLELDHLCRMPRCIRPSHLEAVTHGENQRRACEWGFKGDYAFVVDGLASCHSKAA